MARPHSERPFERDRLARQAAQEILRQPGLDVDSALARARRLPELRAVPAPSRSRVHRHLEALQMQALGAPGFDVQRQAELRAVVDLLDLVEVLLRPEAILLMGRVAGKHPLGAVEVHARLMGGALLEACASELEQAGVREVQLQSVRTSVGHLARMSLENEGRRYVLTRCPLEFDIDPTVNLITGAPIESIALDELRAQVAEPGEDFSSAHP
ncbi:MAG: hypothetical protein CBC35_00970 [Planctomycetes bacterium TMED75]|nr:hypothetical protein [Planctomycetaceae bacterium]OUU96489.1 MAG: hypothetical protein CBC35_00970 [Planctomycetes bacterium TMED75]